ncbi:MAG: arylsulfatase [Verrucomicrobiota bacterium]
MRIYYSIALLSLICAALTAKQPNVLLIMADDFGVGNINAYGASKELVRTPSLNQLAEDGMLFTGANTPGSICSPTRYALITGEYAWRGPLPFGVVNVDDPMIVDTDRKTLPKYFQELGYMTAQVGKWHLGYGSERPVDWTEKLSPSPNDVGFDYHFGLPQNLDDKLRVWIENDQVWGLRSKKLSPYAKSFYGGQYVGLDAPQRERESADRFLAEKAIQWIRTTHRSHPEKPFFMYFAPAAAHHPIVPSEEMRGASDAGAYGDFIQDLDSVVGSLIRTLEYEGIDDETIIIFTADNGSDIPSNDPNRPENQAARKGLEANGINRGDKHTIYEGGARVPLLIRWDGKVVPGSVSDRGLNIVDIYATLAEAVTGETPTAAEAPDSISFAPTLLGEEQQQRPAMITSNAAGLHAIRSGKWKYIDGLFPEGAPDHLKRHFKPQAEPALFDLETDPSESNNMFAQNPEIVERMQRMLDNIRANPTRP